MARRRSTRARPTRQSALQLLVRDRSPAAGMASLPVLLAQREAIETLVWLYEVREVRRHRDLVERFAQGAGHPRSAIRRLRPLRHQDGDRQRQDQVMALAVAWQYFNAVAEGRDDYAKTSSSWHRTSSCSSGCAPTSAAGGSSDRPDHPAGAAHLLGVGLLHARRPGASQLAGSALPHEHPAVLRARLGRDRRTSRTS